MNTAAKTVKISHMTNSNEEKDFKKSYVTNTMPFYYFQVQHTIKFESVYSV